MLSNENGEDSTAASLVNSRTARMLKRQRLKTDKLNPEEETELKNSGLLEDGMTKKMKKDLLKALSASRETAKVEKTDQILPTDLSPVVHSRNGTESPDLFDSDLPLKSNEDSNESTSKVTKPNLERGLIDNRPYKKIQCATIYAPVGVNPDEYAIVVKRNLENYHKRIQELQRKSLDFMEWGPPVVVGERIKDSLDAIGSRKQPCHKPNLETIMTVTTKIQKKKIMSLSDSDEEDSKSSAEEFNIKDNSSVSLKRAWHTTKNSRKKTKEKLDNTKENGPDVMKIEDAATNGDSKKVARNDEAMAMEKPSSSDVMCPLCGHMFQSNKIEKHASDCVGEGQCSQNGNVTAERTNVNYDQVILIGNSDGDSDEEKEEDLSIGLQHCYFCKTDIPRSIFENHVRDCAGSSSSSSNTKSTKLTLPSLSSSLMMTTQNGKNENVPIKIDTPIRKSTGSFYGSVFRSPNSFELPKRSMDASKKKSYSRKSKD